MFTVQQEIKKTYRKAHCNTIYMFNMLRSFENMQKANRKNIYLLIMWQKFTQDPDEPIYIYWEQKFW